MFGLRENANTNLRDCYALGVLRGPSDGRPPWPIVSLVPILIGQVLADCISLLTGCHESKRAYEGIFKMPLLDLIVPVVVVGVVLWLTN